jgi:hypothetical protein
MDPFKKSYSFYETQNNDDEYGFSKNSITQSHSFSYGCNNDSFQDFSQFKSSLNEASKQEPIKEEEGIKSFLK